MPSVVGMTNIKIIQLGAVVHFGDTLRLAPSSSSKTYAGTGSFLTGDVASANNGISATDTYDADIVDDKSAANQAGPNLGAIG